MTVTYFFGKGGYDLHFHMPSLSTGQWVGVRCDSAFTNSDLDDEDATGTVRIKKTATGFQVILLDTSGAQIDLYGFDYPDVATDVRVTVHNDTISVIFGDFWAVTLWLKATRHAETPAVYMLASGAITVTDIRLTELCDCQDKISVDIETSAANAIASVIDRRPIEQWSLYDGSLCFAYDPPVQTLPRVEHAWSIEQIEERNDRAGSDGIAYHQGTAVVVDEDALEELGFATRTFRFTGMEHGAITATRKLMEKARQDRKRHLIRRQMLPALELFDRVEFGIMSAGGIAFMDGVMIVDRLTFGLTGTQAEMLIDGRTA
jgi:hypothetical protein